MLDGDWDIFVGQYFSEWSREIHVCDPFGIPSHWEKIIAFDYGFEKPSAVGWWAIEPEGDWWLYREMYAKGLTYTNLAEQILEMTPIEEKGT